VIANLQPYPAMKDSGVQFKALLRREVLSYAPDTWYAPDSVKTSYGVGFTEGLLGEIIGGAGR